MGNTVDGILITSNELGRITLHNDAIWVPHDVPYILNRDFTIGFAGNHDTPHLTLAAGTTLQVSRYVEISVLDGGLILDGTEENPSLNTASRPSPAGSRLVLPLT